MIYSLLSTVVEIAYQPGTQADKRDFLPIAHLNCWNNHSQQLLHRTINTEVSNLQ